MHFIFRIHIAVILFVIGILFHIETPTVFADPIYTQGISATSDGFDSSISQSFSTNITAGNTIVVTASWGSSDIFFCSDSQGNTYQTATIQYDSQNNQSLGICYAFNVAGGSTTVTAHFGNYIPYRRLLIHEYSGVATVNPLDVTASNIANGSTSSNAITSTPATTTQDGDLIFGAVMDDSGTTSISAGTGFTQRQSVNGKDLVSQDMIQTTAGSIASTNTFGSAHRYLSQMVGFKSLVALDPDTTSPSSPSNLSANASSSNSVTLAWDASVDPIVSGQDTSGISNYEVERCTGLSCSTFTQVGTPASSPFVDSGLTAGTGYSYHVRAVDAAGNMSGWSNVVGATTPTPDTESPTDPANLQVSVISASEIDLSWTASTDNVGVTGYSLERCAGTDCSDFTQIATPSTTSYQNMGLSSNMLYRYRVRAIDAAGNMSGYSSVEEGVTSAIIPNPTLSIDANPALINVGDSSTLSWSSTDTTSCMASGSWSGSKSISGTETVSPTATAQYTLTCLGTNGNSVNQDTTVTVDTSSGTETGLDFPGSAAVSTTMRFRFPNPQDNGLPIYGPNGQGVTYIWKAYTRQQNGYYTTFFWGNDGDFGWGAYPYYGFHPYPYGSGNTHQWEIASGGTDIVIYNGGYVAYDEWHTQVARVWVDGSGTHNEYYYDWPDTSKVITWNTSSSYGNTNPPNPALTWGDAPWPHSTGCVFGECGEGGEVYDGILRGIQIYNNTLSLTDIQNEIDNPLSTTTGANNIWYLNINPTPSDISDKSGQNHNPEWVGTERPTLYSNGPDTTPPTSPTGLSATATSSSSITVSWTASTDDIGVTGYQVERCTGLSCSTFTQVGTPASSPFVDSGLTAGTGYSYHVRAVDAAGNMSGWSNVVGATTPTPDTESPTDPANLQVSVISASEIDLSWTASTDNVGVTGYSLERCAGTDCSDFTQIATPSTTSYQNMGLSSNMLYRYRVRAIDAAGNMSGYSSVEEGVTSAGSSITFVQTANNTSDGSAKTLAKAFTSANTEGNFIVVAASWGNNATLTCSDSQGNSYTTTINQYDSGNNQSLGICYAENIHPGVNTVTATLSKSASYRRLLIHEYSGVATVNPLDVTASNIANGSTSSNAITSTPATTTQDGDLIFGAVMDDSGTTSISAGTGFTQRQSVNGKDLVSQDMIQTTAGSIASTNTFGSAHRYLSQMVGFKHQ